MEFSDKVKGYLNSPPKKGFILTKFLSLSESSSLKRILGNKVEYSLFGGYNDAELKRASIYNNEDFNITCFKIKYDHTMLKLTHQNILGTLLSLSITKDSIGDILANEDVFFIISELSDYIKSEFKMINGELVELSIIDGTHLERVVNLEYYSVTVASTRLDLIVSKITKFSRNDVLDYINSDLVKLNHEITTKHARIVNEEDIISIRKFGRFVILNTKNRSRKGKIVVKYGKYV